MQSYGQGVQNQCQGLQTQIANLTNMLSKIVSSNTASSSGSGTLPSNTITNPKEDLKGITTRSGAAYQGPPIPTKSKVVKQGTKVTKDQVQTPSLQTTAPVQPSVIQSETQTPVSEPVVAPVSVPMPNMKACIPYPSRRDNERRCDQANEQIEKFYEIFKEMSFEISFTDALILMPKYASTLKALIGNKEKLSEMARTPMNEHCSAVILNKLPRKLGDPGIFLIPCKFPGMDECLALADLGASINLMPLSMWEGLSLPELTPTCMTLKLTDRSVSKPIGIAKDVSVKVGVFHFPADFVVVDFEPDPRVPLILERCFLKTDRALIDMHKGELTLRIGTEAITYNLDQTVRYSANYNQMTANKIDVIYEMYTQEVLSFFDVTVSGNPTPYDDPIVSTTSATLTLFGESDFLIFEEADSFLEDYKLAVQHQRRVNPKIYDVIKKEVGKLLDARLIYPISDSPWVSPVHCVPKKGGLTIVVNEENELILTRLVTEWWECIDYRKLNEATRKDYFPLPFMDQMLERLARNEYYCFLSGFFRCEDTNLSLNWEKSYFMVKEGIVLGHKISKNGIEVDRAKVDVIAKLPHPTTVKGIWSFLGHAGFYRRFIQDFSKISRPMTHLLEKNTPFIFCEDCIKAFQTLKKRLTKAPILIAPSWDLPFELMCDASDFAIGEIALVGSTTPIIRFQSSRDTKGAENLAADYLSRLENPYENMLDPKEINENFPLETLSVVTFHGDSSAPWFAESANYHAGNFIVKGMTSQQK
nr:reverse transcriptase domain-containing protein [Tanacetum cinerariifolium]